jgi:HlyD family secretion protein
VVLVGLIGFAAFKWIRARDFNYAGTIEATEIDLSSRLTSVIASYEVKESDVVDAGKTLVTFTCEEEKLAADIAEKDFHRAEKLYHAGSTPQENYDRLKYQRDQAAEKLSWCNVRSPISGKILETYQEAGERVTPGTKLVTVADLSQVHAYFYVPQPLLAQLSLGMEITGRLPEMPGRTFAGKIAHIRDDAEFTPKNVQTRDERTRLVYGVKVNFANPDHILKPGMTIESKLTK